MIWRKSKASTGDIMAKSKTPYHQRFAETMIEDLKKGTAPWQRPWKAGEYQPAFNPVSGTVYRGVNQVMLGREGLNDPRFMTYKQASSQEWQVKKGAKSETVIFWQLNRPEVIKDEQGKPVRDEDGELTMKEIPLARPILRYANVFHASQIEGIPEWKGRDISWNPDERAETILDNSGAEIHHDQRDRAFYRPASDEIHLPPRGAFESSDKYYGTALHELGHWTGHSSRLDREGGPFGSELYAREELRAEIASWMISSELGLSHDPDQHLSYVDSWIKALEKDPYEIVRACQDADKIKNYTLSLEQGRSMEATKTQKQEIAPAKNPAIEKTYLTVPYSEKGQAKKLGARWDKSKKLWFAATGTDLDPLSNWMPKNKIIAPTGNPEQEFAKALQHAGLDLQGQLPIMDGTLQRVPVIDGKLNSRDGAYTGHLDDHPAGFIQNHKTGLKMNWKAEGHKLTEEQKAELKIVSIQKKQEREKDLKVQREKASKRSYAKWKNAKDWANDKQPYLAKKGVYGYGVKVSERGNLIIPGRDVNGHIHTLQTVTEDAKLFEKGGLKTGTFHTIDPDRKIDQGGPILIAEGYATAASIHMATGEPTIVAFDASNLEPVAKALHVKYPDSPIAVLGDTDHHLKINVGKEKAETAAKSVGGMSLIPKFTANNLEQGLSDFNDLHQKSGLEEVKNQLAGFMKVVKKSVIKKTEGRAMAM